MDPESLIVNIKAEDIYVVIVKDLEMRFDTSNYSLERPSSKGKNKVMKVIKYEWGGKIMLEFTTLRPKAYTHLINDGDEEKKQKAQRSVS